MAMIAAARLLHSRGPNLLFATASRAPVVIPFVSPFWSRTLHQSHALYQSREIRVNHKREQDPMKALLDIRWPGLFVPLRLSEWPRNPRDFLRYWYQVMRFRFGNFVMRFMIRWKEKPKLFSFSRLQYHSGRIGSEAKELHRQLWTAVAKADRRTLRTLCSVKYQRLLIQEHIDTRAVAEAWSWKVKRYHRRPRVLVNIVAEAEGTYIQQCVVAIDSTQWLDRITPIIGKECLTLERRVENLLILRPFDHKTRAPLKWQIWGPVQGMTLADLERNQALQYQINLLSLKEKRLGAPAPTLKKTTAYN